MIVHVSESYLRLVDGQPSIQLECSTAREGVLQLYNRYPQLLVEIMESPASSGLWMVFLDGIPLLTEEEFEQPSTAESVLRIERLVPSGEHGSFVDIMLDIFVPVLGQFALAASTGKWSKLTHGLAWMTPGLRTLFGEKLANYNQAWAMKIGGYIGQVVGLVIPIFGLLGSLSTMAGDMQLAYLDGAYQTFSPLAGSATYTWEGVENTTPSGTSVGIVYGEHRVGGQVINLYTKNSAQQVVNDITQSQTYLYEQIALCEGEIESVSEVLLSDVPSTNYNQVFTAPLPEFYRLGSEGQESMPGFDSIEGTQSMEIKAKRPVYAPVPQEEPQHLRRPVYGYVLEATQGSSGVSTGLYTFQE